MPDRPSNGGRQRESPAEPDVDDEVQRRLREAYLNDAERELIVTGVRSADGEVVVEFRTPHGDATHTERFRAPSHGSLAESEAFVAFLETVGVSPLDVDAVVGARVPATYEGGEWRLDESYLPGGVGDGEAGRDDGAGRDSTARREGAAGSGGDPDGGGARQRSAWTRSREWLWTYRYWLFAALLVGGELLFVAVVIALYG